MRVGMLATADRGALFLDEIGELPIDLQAKLLRAIPECEVRPLGSNQTKPRRGTASSGRAFITA